MMRPSAGYLLSDASSSSHDDDHDERVDRSQLFVGLDLARFDTEIPKDREVRSEGALERQDTDGDRAGHQPRSASLVSSVAISRPFMASPRPVDTFARIWGSW